MSNFADEADAITLADFYDFLECKGIIEAEAGTCKREVALYLQERAVNREASFGKR